MSKIGKKPIAVPSGVTASFEGGVLTVKGSKATLTRPMPIGITMAISDGSLNVGTASENPSRAERAQWGLARALAANMIVGVSTGWTKTLEFQGVGYKAVVKGKDLELALGYSHPITVTAPEGVTFVVEKTTITISGADREAVGHAAALIRSKRLPEPYKGSGIRYSTEIIKKKAGKKAATAA
jgi:large subunit ribosomal protein L6